MRASGLVVSAALCLSFAALGAACGDSVEVPSSTGAGGASASSSATATSTSGSSSSAGGGGSGGGLMPGECRTSTDCDGMDGSFCAYPGAPSCGGAGCFGEPCAVDGDCVVRGGLSVCELDSCCGVLICKAGCSVDTDCGEGQSCAADHHCVAQSCASGGCPSDFDCGGDALPVCLRRSCVDDSACDGYCVLGSCYSTPGSCEQPAP